MSVTDGHAAEGDGLAGRLDLLNAAVRRAGRTQKAAVDEANRRSRTAAGRSPEVAWPRAQGGADLSPTTVNDWFPKKSNPDPPSVPAAFEDLWAVVEVMLDWTGQLTDRRSAEALRRQWSRLHEGARLGANLDAQVLGYLAAARTAVEQHPYPGLAGQETPSLAELYVRQRSRPTEHGGSSSPHPPRAAMSLAEAEPGEALFQKGDRVCVVVAGPGSGKSTLLRTRLRDTADAWLTADTSLKRTPAAVPLWVSARSLAGDQTQIAEALAAATRALSRYGRHPELDKARFLARPSTGTHWQLLVDDLDELPNADQRRAVLEKLARAVTLDPALYRCIVVTRPLAENELDVLDRILGRPVPRYDLEPFTPDDLHTYTDKYFSTRWPEQEVSRHTERFGQAIHEAALDDLARTPLMAFMLCQLYLTDPDRVMPGGRSAVYEAFTHLLYDNNQNKHIADSHEQAIRHLVEARQSPQSRQDAETAARQVHQHLPKLIDFLAYQWLADDQAPAAEVLAAHEIVRRPDRVDPELWQAFLEDLLRHTGLLVHHADGPGFSHRTYLEFHAARHATRDQHARTALLERLFPSTRKPKVPQVEASYLGFLLDRLLAAPDGNAAGTAERIEALTRAGGRRPATSSSNRSNSKPTSPPRPPAGNSSGSPRQNGPRTQMSRLMPPRACQRSPDTTNNRHNCSPNSPTAPRRATATVPTRPRAWQIWTATGRQAPPGS